MQMQLRSRILTDGSLFLFVNRRRDRIKVLWWETGGLTLWYRRLEKGTKGTLHEGQTVCWVSTGTNGRERDE